MSCQSRHYQRWRLDFALPSSLYSRYTLSMSPRMSLRHVHVAVVDGHDRCDPRACPALPLLALALLPVLVAVREVGRVAVPEQRVLVLPLPCVGCLPQAVGAPFCGGHALSARRLCWRAASRPGITMLPPSSLGTRPVTRCDPRACPDMRAICIRTCVCA